MTDQLWTLVAVALGAFLTGGLSWIKDRATHERTEQADRRKASLDLCVALLEAVDKEADTAVEWEMQHGAMPGSMGHDEHSSATRTQLTALELRCPTSVFEAASELVAALEGFAYRTTGTWKDYTRAREDYVSAVQTKL